MKMKHFVLKIVLVQFLITLCASLASAQYVQLMDYTNQVWRYNDVSTSASNPQATYMTPGFNDSGADWKTGKALFGNDDANVYNSPNHPFRGGVNGFATPLNRTGNRVTFYFRTHFNLASAPVAGATLFSTNYLDDGAVFYINGTEVGRLRVPAGALTWDSLGSNPATEGAPTRIDMPADALVVGDNVLAVEVHQSGPGSSDVAFAMNLILINPFHPVILDTNLPADVTVVENRPFTLRCVADASPPIAYQWFFNGGPISGANSPTYSVARATAAEAGEYYCMVSNPVGSTNSRTATVTVIEDEAPPLVLGALAGNFTTVTVQFDEALDPQTSQDGFNWALYDSGGGVVDLSATPATLSADGTIVTLTLAEGTTLEQDALYTVAAGSGIFDLAGNTLVPAPEDPNSATNITFRTFTTAGCNTFLFEAFDTTTSPGNAVSLLTSHTNYPNYPRDAANMASLDSRHAYPDNTHEQFGARVRGLYVPLISGPHTFYLASDDAGQLWVNPTGPDAAGKQLVAQEINCCNDFQPTGDAKTSVPINLQAGRAYYVEALFKEGTGGDWLKVAARPSGAPVPPGGNGDNASVSPNVIQGGAGPAGILSHVTIGTQPANQTVIAGGRTTFTVRLSPDVPACFQWKRNGVDIPGAVGQSYPIFAANLADDGAEFSVSISLMGGTTLTSSPAVLDVFEDVTAPTVASVSQDVLGNITVTFSEPVADTGATNPANYAIDGVAPASATLSGGSVVLLTPAAPMAPCPATHTVTVSNVRDIYNNLITPNPTSVSVTLNDLLLLPINALTSWRYDESGNELGDAWYASAFDDSTWSNGVPAFGVETATVLPPGVPIRTPHNWSPVKLTLYYRTHFNLASDPSSITNLQIHHYIDDGAVFYLNGQELTRIRIPAGTPTTNVLADNYAETTPGVLSVSSVPTGLLQSGDNVLAARVHQSGPTSSDTVFAAGLVGQSTGCALRPRLSISRSGNQVTISATAPGGTIHRAPSITGPWSPLGAAPQTVTIGADEFYTIRP